MLKNVPEKFLGFSSILGGLTLIFLFFFTMTSFYLHKLVIPKQIIITIILKDANAKNIEFPFQIVAVCSYFRVILIV